MDFPHRAGRYIQQPTGYRAFVPVPLPPDPPIEYSGELQTLLSSADRDIGRLDALAALLPNPDLFVAMYVRHEAVLSSQIEGTQSTLEDVLAYEADALRDDTPKDVAEVVNYVRAMNHGLARLPLSLRLLYPVPANKRYSGKFRFDKHFYPVVADLEDGGEEWRCALAIDEHPKVRRWVRNLDSDPVAGFWLPVSTGRFYPDFVCELMADCSLQSTRAITCATCRARSRRAR